MSGRAANCEPGEAIGRLRKAEELYDAAIVLEGAPNAVVTLLAHAAIAASDAICCAALGRRSRGEDHSQAGSLLRTVSPDGAKLSDALGQVLAMKSRAGYSSVTMKSGEVTKAMRRVELLLQAARRVA